MAKCKDGIDDSDDVYSDFEGIPLRIMNASSRMLLSQYLNIEQIIPSSKNQPRDLRGLAEINGLSYTELNHIQRSDDPMKLLLEFLETKGSKSKTVTIKDLLLMLETIERFDVVDDILPLLKRDVETYRERQEKFSNHSASPLPITSMEPYTNGCLSDSETRLSLDDSVYYDAYVCYADADVDFVKGLADYLESEPFRMRLYIRDRDHLMGHVETDSFMQLLQERCRRMLIILSPEFLSSPQCSFQAKFATGLAVEYQKRMLLPIIIKECRLPPLIRMMTKVDLTQASIPAWIWRKLVLSIQSPDEHNSISIDKYPPPPIVRQLQIIKPTTGIIITTLPSETDATDTKGSVIPSAPRLDSLSSLPPYTSTENIRFPSIPSEDPTGDNSGDKRVSSISGTLNLTSTKNPSGDNRKTGLRNIWSGMKRALRSSSGDTCTHQLLE